MAIRSYARIKLGINSPQMAHLALWGDLSQFWLAQTTKQPQVVQLCRRCPRKEYRVFFTCSLHNCTTSSLVMQSYNHALKKEVQRRHSPKRVKGALMRDKRRLPGRRSPTSRSLRLTPAAPQHAAGASSDPLRSRVRHVQTGASLNALFLLLASCRRWRDHDRRVCSSCV